MIRAIVISPIMKEENTSLKKRVKVLKKKHR